MGLYVEVNSISRDAMSINVEWSLKQRSTAEVTLRDIGFNYTVSEGQQVVIGDETAVRWAGTVDEVTASWLSRVNMRTWRLRCVSFEQIATRRLTGRRYYSRQAAGAIVRDLVDNCLTGEGIDTTSVLDGPDVGPFEFDFATVEEAIDEVAKAASYYWDILHDRQMRFFSRTTYSAPWNVTDTSSTVRRLEISARTDRQKVANRVYVRIGQYLEDLASEVIAGDGTERTFATLKPIGAAPAVMLNGEAQTVGIQGVDTGKDWYWQLGSASLYQDDAGTVLSASDRLQVDYLPLDSRVILGAEDMANISARAAVEGLSGAYETIIDANTPTTGQDARTLAAAFLANSKDSAQVVEFDTIDGDIGIGQVININLPSVAVAADFLIETVSLSATPGQLANYHASCSRGPLLPTWQQILGGSASSSAQGFAISGQGTTGQVESGILVSYPE